jgi:hypothetical protein
MKMPIKLLIQIIIGGLGDWGLGIGDWGLGIGPNPQSPIPNPQSPIPNPHFNKIILSIILAYNKKIKF